MKRPVLLGLAVMLGAVGCSRCGSSSGGFDAGAHAIHRATDLRTALMEALPEWRGVLIEEGQATLRREVEGKVDSDLLHNTLVANGFEVESRDGGVWAHRDRLVFYSENPQVLELRVILQPNDPDRLIGSPTVMTTENIANWFPKGPGAGVEKREDFSLMLKYTGKTSRVDFLSRQLWELSTRGTWKPIVSPDWPDAGPLPDHHDFELLDASGARLTSHREGDHVTLKLTLVTFEPETR